MENPEPLASPAAPTFSVLDFHSPDFPDQYVGLVIATWLKSLRHSNDWFRLIDPHAYYAIYKNAIKSILANPDTHIRIAVLTEDKDVAFGYCVYRDKILDYVFVLADYRRQGIGRAILPRHIEIYTHLTKLGRELVKSKKPHWLFNPFV